jgi:hypothetical protein
LPSGAFEDGSIPDQHRQRFGLVKQRIADADTAADYAAQLWAGGDVGQELHEEVEKRIRRLSRATTRRDRCWRCRSWSRLGAAAGTSRRDRQPGRARHRARTGFDRWCRLTDPMTRQRWRKDARARKAIDSL